MPEHTEEKQAIINKIREIEAHAHGSMTFYAAGPLFRGSVYTEGVQAVAKAAGAFWLCDEILSHHKVGNNPSLRVKHEEYFWKLELKASGGARLFCDDGNGNVHVEQNIPYTDFPLDNFRIWVGPRYNEVQEQCGWTLMLPGER